MNGGERHGRMPLEQAVIEAYRAARASPGRTFWVYDDNRPEDPPVLLRTAAPNWRPDLEGLAPD